MKISAWFLGVFMIGAAIFCFPAKGAESAPIQTLKVLAIGNSFSADALENYLHDLAKADGVALTIGNLMIGGCSLERHWKNASGDLPEYSYLKIGADGKKFGKNKVTLAYGLAAEDWDVITFQQVSPQSGMPPTYLPFLSELLQYVKERAKNPQVQYALHQTWAYAKDAKHSGFANYDRDQDKMYAAIVNTARQVGAEVGITMIIPSGTAIQNGRAALGDIFCRDGYHLDLGIGRFTAACAWYEKLTGRSVVENSYRPEKLTAEQAAAAKLAAHNAVAQPNAVTPAIGE